MVDPDPDSKTLDAVCTCPVSPHPHRHPIVSHALAELETWKRDDPEEFCPDCFAGMESSEHHEKCVAPLDDEIDCGHHSWVGLMALLDEHWPEDIFPTREDDIRRDAGARIVSLIRWVDRLRGAR